MHYTETFTTYKEKQTISNKDQIFWKTQTPKQRKQTQYMTIRGNLESPGKNKEENTRYWAGLGTTTVSTCGISFQS